MLRECGMEDLTIEIFNGQTGNMPLIACVCDNLMPDSGSKLQSYPSPFMPWAQTR